MLEINKKIQEKKKQKFGSEVDLPDTNLPYKAANSGEGLNPGG